MHFKASKVSLLHLYECVISTETCYLLNNRTLLISIYCNNRCMQTLAITKLLFTRMTVGSQTALTFLMEAAPELPDPEYLQNHKQARLKAAANDLWFL